MDNKPKDIILLQEHQPFANPDGVGNGLDYSSKMDYLYGLNLRFQETGFLKEPKFLGINDWTASYYIGAAWLVPDELAVVVTPKLPDIDFVQMFLAALEVDTQKESNYFAQCYGIHFDEPQIETREELNQLTPLLVLHFISLLERLVKHGLKKDYLLHEENLKAKVKGRILFGKHLKTNIFQQRNGRMYCQYQEYTDDIPENRLMKKALLFSERILDRCDSLKRQSQYPDVQLRLNRLKTSFSHISDDIEPYQVQKLSSNKLFKGYKEAIKVAKMILRRFDYSIREASSEQHSTSPFWIDMARLYEMWVLCKLQKCSINPVLFQESGFYGRQVADFVIREENLILDAKYKSKYVDDWVDIDDIRELSGNARDDRLLPNLPEDYSPRCIILYPGKSDELKPESDILFEQQGQKIPHYRNFYKISVPLPVYDNEHI
ncbi:MAG: TonB-dependent receptor [Bacteroidales bacterium]|nr:TonB-dependent receptor [Bacteroidales bacterium]